MMISIKYKCSKYSILDRNKDKWIRVVLVAPDGNSCLINLGLINNELIIKVNVSLETPFLINIINYINKNKKKFIKTIKKSKVNYHDIPDKSSIKLIFCTIENKKLTLLPESELSTPNLKLCIGVILKEYNSYDNKSIIIIKDYNYNYYLTVKRGKSIIKYYTDLIVSNTIIKTTTKVKRINKNDEIVKAILDRAANNYFMTK